MKAAGEVFGGSFVYDRPFFYINFPNFIPVITAVRPRMFCNVMFAMANMYCDWVISLKFSYMNDENVVNAPKNPMKMRAFSCGFVENLYSEIDHSRPNRRQPVMFTTAVPNGNSDGMFLWIRVVRE